MKDLNLKNLTSPEVLLLAVIFDKLEKERLHQLKLLQYPNFLSVLREYILGKRTVDQVMTTARDLNDYNDGNLEIK